LPQHFCLITCVLSFRASLLTPPSTCLQCVFATSLRKRNRHSVGCLNILASPVKRLPMQWPVTVCSWWSVVWRSFRRCSRLFSWCSFFCLARRMDPRAENQITTSEPVSVNVAVFFTNIMREEIMIALFWTYRMCPTPEVCCMTSRHLIFHIVVHLLFPPTASCVSYCKVHFAIFHSMSVITFRKFWPSLPVLALHRVLWILCISPF
jgi:hypothetical protein